MAHSPKQTYGACNASGDAVSVLHDGSGGCYLRIYSVGSGIPTNADDAITDQVLLAELRGSADFAPSASNGVVTASTISDDTDANATGTAAFYRTYKTDGTSPELQGTAGEAADTCDMTLNSKSIQAHATVSCTSFTYTVPRA
jgi:hypothetical protein